MKIRIDEGNWHRLVAALRAREDVETAAIMLGEPLSTPDGPLIVIREVVPVPNEGYSVRRIDQLSIDPIVLNRLVRPARDRSWSIFTIHTHPGASEAWFSRADDAGDARLMPALRFQSPDAFHGSMVLANGDCLVARTFDANGLACVADVQVVGRTLASPRGVATDVEPWFARQVLALGAWGHARLRKLRVAVVGLGGIGSIVALQLGHLGIGELVLIDGDRIEASNVSRISGATIEDASRSFKVDVAARYIERLGLGTTVEIHRTFFGPDLLPSVGGCDVVVSCVDKQTPRALLNRAAYRYLTPVIDLGTAFRVDRAGGLVGDAGRVVVLAPGRPCLACWDHLDPEALRVEALSDEERKREVMAGYIDGANEAQPSVIAFNAMIAGAGVIELLRLVTRFAGSESPPQRLAFSFADGTVRRNRVGGIRECEICGGYRGPIRESDTNSPKENVAHGHALRCDQVQ
jgi:molybdopterin/thiamine biosynthesis adenylyltransferase